MKRSLYDSEYDRIRKAAGYTAPRYEFPDEEGETAAARRTADRINELNDDFRARMAALGEMERQKIAAAQASLDAWRKEHNERQIKREYEQLGLIPPEPLVSLSMLYHLGWTVQMVGNENVLVRPLHAAPRRREEEYDDL
jgi:hypothetical protein